MKSERIVDTLEGLYADHATLPVWGATVAAHVSTLFDHRGTAALAFDSRLGVYDMAEFAHVPQLDGARAVVQRLGEGIVAKNAFTQFIRVPHPVARSSGMPPLVRAALKPMLDLLDAGDLLGMVTEPEAGIGFVVGAGVDIPTTVTTRDRSQLTRLALHLEASMRARVRPDSVIGTLSPGGHFDLSSETIATDDRAEVTRHMREVETSRLRRNRAHGARALEVWHALVAGKFSLLERVEPGGQRVYVVCENAPRHLSLRALSSDEAAVVAEAARGLRNKEVGYALGLSEMRVARSLGHAARKLGMPSVRELLRIAARLRQTQGTLEGLDGLTGAERTVAKLAGHGLSNAAIADQRGVSACTVANQIASILRKTGASSRRSLAQLD